MDILHWIGVVAGIGCIISVSIVFIMSWKEISGVLKIVLSLMLISSILGIVALLQIGLNQSITPLMIITG